MLDVQGFALSIINEESLFQYSIQEDYWQIQHPHCLSCSLYFYGVQVMLEFRSHYSTYEVSYHTIINLSEKKEKTDNSSHLAGL